jgi:hypothetical protein
MRGSAVAGLLDCGFESHRVLEVNYMFRQVVVSVSSEHSSRGVLPSVLCLSVSWNLDTGNSGRLGEIEPWENADRTTSGMWCNMWVVFSSKCVKINQLKTKMVVKICLWFDSHCGPRPPYCSGFLDHTRLDTSHSVGPLWMRKRPVAYTSTRQHTTFTRERFPSHGAIRAHDTSKQAVVYPRRLVNGTSSCSLLLKTFANVVACAEYVFCCQLYDNINHQSCPPARIRDLSNISGSWV